MLSFKKPMQIFFAGLMLFATTHCGNKKQEIKPVSTETLKAEYTELMDKTYSVPTDTWSEKQLSEYAESLKRLEFVEAELRRRNVTRHRDGVYVRSKIDQLNTILAVKKMNLGESATDWQSLLEPSPGTPDFDFTPTDR